MPKRVELQDKGKIRGIRRRWLLNSIGVLALIMVLLWATFARSEEHTSELQSQR